MKLTLIVLFAVLVAVAHGQYCPQAATYVGADYTAGDYSATFSSVSCPSGQCYRSDNSSLYAHGCVGQEQSITYNGVMYNFTVHGCDSYNETSSGGGMYNGDGESGVTIGTIEEVFRYRCYSTKYCAQGAYLEQGSTTMTHFRERICDPSAAGSSKCFIAQTAMSDTNNMFDLGCVGSTMFQSFAFGSDNQTYMETAAMCGTTTSFTDNSATFNLVDNECWSASTTSTSYSGASSVQQPVLASAVAAVLALAYAL